MMRSWKTVQRFVSVIGAIAFIGAFGLTVHYGYTRPSTPDHRSGRVIPMAYHQAVVYLTARESWGFKLCLGLSVVCLAVAVVIEETAKRRKARL